MDNNDQQLKKRFDELARKSYNQGIYLFTDFLSMPDAAIACDSAPAGYVTLFGGTDGCERVMARFGNAEEFGYEEDFPIDVVMIEPLIKKFSDEVTHRDFLGALMNLGIERDVIGDIMIRDKTAYVFATRKIVPYIADSLDKVKHTSVKCRILSTEEITASVSVELERQELVISSERLDAVISKLYNMSRSQSIEMFRDKKVFVNGRQYENNSGVVKPGDVVAVRGFGKFVYEGIIYETKKGRICVAADRYV